MTILNLNDELVVLEASGSDSTVYLQGQLTNDIRELADRPYQLTAHLNNKGRILATFIATSLASDCYYLITSRKIAASILPRLKMFILRSKVKLELKELDLALSTQACADAINLQLTPESYLNIGGAMPDSAISASYNWHKFLLSATIPMIYPETQEKIIPQHVNYDLIGGINFKKGCYTGQEIVARSHYLGKIKRRMVIFHCATQTEIGQTVVSPRLDNQEVGIIIDCYHENGVSHGLVTLQTDCLEQAFLDQDNQQQLICTPLISILSGE